MHCVFLLFFYLFFLFLFNTKMPDKRKSDDALVLKKELEDARQQVRDYETLYLSIFSKYEAAEKTNRVCHLLVEKLSEQIKKIAENSEKMAENSEKIAENSEKIKKTDSENHLKTLKILENSKVLTQLIGALVAERNELRKELETLKNKRRRTRGDKKTNSQLRPYSVSLACPNQNAHPPNAMRMRARGWLL